MAPAAAPSGLARRALALVGATALGFALLGAAPATGQQDVPAAMDGDEMTAAQEADVTPARVAGATRVGTAANIAMLTYDDAEVAHLVFGGDFPDALAASYGAGVVDGPILMPATAADVGEVTWAALEELGVQEVRLVGGDAVLGPALDEQLTERGYDTTRIAGSDRYGTAAQLALTYGQGPAGAVGTVEEQRTALLASGADFPDALAAGPLAGHANLPLLLTPADRAHPATTDALERLDIDRLVVVGGDAAVSPAVEQHYRNLGYTVERVAGADRTATASRLADWAVQKLGFAEDLVLLARGDNFPDALAASVHGADAGAPILLTHTPGRLSQPAAAWLAGACPRVDAVRALGGEAAVQTGTLAAAVDSAEACSTDATPRTQQSYIQAPQEIDEAAPGYTFEISVSGFADPDNPAPVNIALFPCHVAAPADPDDNTFRDANGDGFADGIATTDTGQAGITSLRGAPTAAKHLADVRPAAHHRISYTIHSDAPDCTIPVVFHDANDNNNLDVDAQGRPLEHWNATLRLWQ